MSKMLRVAWYEYARHALRRRFIFALLSLPALVVVLTAVIVVLVRMELSTAPLGYVDRTGDAQAGQPQSVPLLADPLPAPAVEPPDEPLEIIAYTSEDEARAALDSGEIQGYYVLPADYLQTRKARLFYTKQPSEGAQRQFENFLRVNILRGQPAEVQERLMGGNAMVIRSIDGRQEMDSGNMLGFFAPFILGMVLIIGLFTNTGYLMQAVVEEKENRTMEILVTSVSPEQMMAGKIIGIIAVGLTQITAWVGLGWLVLFLTKDQFAGLRSFHLDPGYLWLAMGICLLGFVIFSGLMAAVGVIATDAREGQQVAALFTLPASIPYYFSVVIMFNPNGPLSVGLSYFPLTAPIAVILRAGFTTIPASQVVTILAVLVLSAIGALWLAGRALRLGMLRYGQRVRWRELFSRPAAKKAPEGGISA